MKFQYESDVYATINALRVAAEQYDKDAITCAPGHAPLERQFRDQAKTARRIAAELEAQT